MKALLLSGIVISIIGLLLTIIVVSDALAPASFLFHLS